MMDKPKKNTGYTLSRQWHDFAFEHQGKVRPSHAALYFWLIELNNSLGWIEVFGVPTLHSMAAIGVSSYKTYKKAFDDLVAWGFVEVLEKSKNQSTTNLVTLKNAIVINTKALDAALVNNAKASPQQISKQVHSTAHINKQGNNKTKKPINLMSEVFTSDYEPINTYDSIAFKFWKQIYDNLIAKDIKPTSLQRSKIKEWTREVRLMIEKDSRTEDEINELIDFLAKDSFWANNIKSTSKLREKFEDLLSRTRTINHTSQQMYIAFKESEQNYEVSINDI